MTQRDPIPVVLPGVATTFCATTDWTARRRGCQRTLVRECLEVRLQMAGDFDVPLGSLGQLRSAATDVDVMVPAVVWQPQPALEPLPVYGPQLPFDSRTLLSRQSLPGPADISTGKSSAADLRAVDQGAVDVLFSLKDDILNPIYGPLPLNFGERNDGPEASVQDTDDTVTNLGLGELAGRLVESGTQFFGAHWCGYCGMQKAIFGDAVSSLPYVEVANLDGTPNEIAISQNINVYPTWRFQGSFADHESVFRRETSRLGEAYDSSRVIERADGFDVLGVLQPSQLAALVGMKLGDGAVAEGEEPNENPYRDPDNSFDVDNSGIVSALDALIIINELGRGGARVLPTEGPEVTGIKFVDVTGDGSISALDALRVINQLARNDANPFETTVPTGPLASLGDQVITWTAAPLVGTPVYEVSLANDHNCLPENILATRTNVTGTQTPMFTEVTEDGTYFLCLRARNEDDIRLTPAPQGVEIVLALERFHTVFLSSTSVPLPDGPIFPNSVSNLKHFDLKCSEMASNAGLIQDWDGESVVYKAIMSDDFNDARTRIAVQGKVITTTGKIIANNDEELWDGNLDHPISWTEFGTFDFDPGNSVYSGTLIDGSRSIGQNCENWTVRSSSVGGITGVAGVVHSGWIASGNISCSVSRRTFCISPFTNR